MIENHTTSLETSRRLKEAGFPQEAEHYWWRHGISDYSLITHQRLQSYRILRWVQDWMAAPLFTEIYPQLPQAHPNDSKATLTMGRPDMGGLAPTFFAWYLNDDPAENGIGKAEAGQHHDNPAEALALLWLQVKGGDGQ